MSRDNLDKKIELLLQQQTEEATHLKEETWNKISDELFHNSSASSHTVRKKLNLLYVIWELSLKPWLHL